MNKNWNKIEEVKEEMILTTTEREQTASTTEETNYPKGRKRRAEETLKFRRETLSLNISLDYLHILT